jgi:hypothetical protein
MCGHSLNIFPACRQPRNIMLSQRAKRIRTDPSIPAKPHGLPLGHTPGSGPRRFLDRPTGMALPHNLYANTARSRTSNTPMAVALGKT